MWMAGSMFGWVNRSGKEEVYLTGIVVTYGSSSLFHIIMVPPWLLDNLNPLSPGGVGGPKDPQLSKSLNALK